jgi:hypothetical protein
MFTLSVGIGSIGVLLLTLLAGLAATTYEAQIASRQRDNALEANRRSLTQTASARLQEGDVVAALSIILEVLISRGAKNSYCDRVLRQNCARLGCPDGAAIDGTRGPH